MNFLSVTMTSKNCDAKNHAKIGFGLSIYFTVRFDETFEYSTSSKVDKATPCFEFEDIGSETLKDRTRRK